MGTGARPIGPSSRLAKEGGGEHQRGKVAGCGREGVCVRELERDGAQSSKSCPCVPLHDGLMVTGNRFRDIIVDISRPNPVGPPCL